MVLGFVSNCKSAAGLHQLCFAIIAKQIETLPVQTRGPVNVEVERMYKVLYGAVLSHLEGDTQLP